MATLQHQDFLTHSRESSTASSVSVPLTPTFSTRTHNHWPSSSSSLASSPVMTKSPLGDLVEEAEDDDDDDVSYMSPIEPFDVDLCMCDTPFCVHEPRSALRKTSPTIVDSSNTALPEWSAGDDAMDLDWRRSKRRKSSEYSIQSLSNKFSRRFPSISRRWRDLQPTTSLSHYERSATPPRSTSLRLPKVRSSLVHALDSQSGFDRSLSIGSPARRSRESGPRIMSPTPLDITAPPTPIEEEPIDRQSMSRTPLLPPLLSDYRSLSEDNAIRSPLQSPSIASSAFQSPATAPVMGIYTPPLSTSPSFASFKRYPHADVPPMDLGIETDPWALKLGHANFHILPEPYVPTECTRDTCKRLLEDWESARTEYMRQAARVSEDYGCNSQTFQLTEEKWSEIDAQWRANHKLANERAEASGEAIMFQPLAMTAPTQKMPTLSDDPNASAKFPVINESDIVGPMVQYAKVTSTSPAKKPGLLRLLTDSTSLFTRTPFHIRR